MMTRTGIALLALAGVTPAAATEGGFDIGVAVADYGYRETVDGETVVRDDGTMWGLAFGYTETLSSGFFLRAEARGLTGEIDYRSDEGDALENVDQSLADIRLLLGKDFSFGSALVTVAAGYGVRALYDESGGSTTSTGLTGYDRTVTYRYLPVSAAVAVPVGGRVSLQVSGEYRAFLDGDSENEFSDVEPDAPDLTFDQDEGDGWRLAAMLSLPLGQRHLLVGPFYEGWSVDESEEIALTDDAFGTVSLSEPKNRTRLFGLAVSLQF